MTAVSTALECVMDILSSFVNLRDTAGHRTALIFLRDLKALLNMGENRETFLQLDVSV